MEIFQDFTVIFFTEFCARHKNHKKFFPPFLVHICVLSQDYCNNFAVTCQDRMVIGSEKIRLIAQIMKIEIFVPSCRASQVQQNDV